MAHVNQQKSLEGYEINLAALRLHLSALLDEIAADRFLVEASVEAGIFQNLRKLTHRYQLPARLNNLECRMLAQRGNAPLAGIEVENVLEILESLPV